MTQLNYKHLLYFWTVAREGSVTRACGLLHLTQPAISAQIHKLERQLGEKLFQKSGRNLVLTEAGQVAFRYADDIFRTGHEMVDVLKGRPTGRPLRLAVGIADSIPKLVAYRLLEPALALPDPVEMVLVDDRPDRLLAELSIHALDLVLTDSPLPPTSSVKAYNHLLGECGVTLFARAEQAAELRDGYPASLNGAPFLMPTENTTLRRSLELWFDQEEIRPRTVAQIADSALLKAFGQAGAGVFASPSVIDAEVRRQFRVEAVGTVESIRERFYAISVERKLKNPAVVAICESARQHLFEAARPRRTRKARPGAGAPAQEAPSAAE
ncbi:MAG TPA: transcriptional activator NhaR [Longimicrobium sp.]|jgi:LysR family transcriptional activator of nhaA|uniref:transcriptional activator NhaR n=1 Tax=Longimicrobium sp. TaxID=2029185 RepID=UPI002EDAC009